MAAVLMARFLAISRSRPFSRASASLRVVAMAVCSDTGRNAGTIKKVGWQTNNALDIPTPNQLTPNHSLDIASEQYTVW